MILPSYEGVFSSVRTIDGNICIGNMSLRKYMQNFIKPISDRKNITCVYKTCISAMLIQSDLNTWRISQLAKLDKLYIHFALNRLLERSKNDFIEYKKHIFPNDSHIH